MSHLLARSFRIATIAGISICVFALTFLVGGKHGKDALVSGVPFADADFPAPASSPTPTPKPKPKPVPPPPPAPPPRIVGASGGCSGCSSGGCGGN